MIHVLATAPIKTGCLEAALACYRLLVPEVRAREAGCIAYVPTVDLSLGLPNQDEEASTIVVIECWNAVADFRRHLEMDHCVEFRRRIAPYMRGGIRVRIVRDAL